MKTKTCSSLCHLPILPYLDVVGVDKLVEVGVETLEDVDAEDDVETELDVDTLERERRKFQHKL